MPFAVFRFRTLLTMERVLVAGLCLGAEGDTATAEWSQCGCSPWFNGMSQGGSQKMEAHSGQLPIRNLLRRVGVFVLPVKPGRSS